MDNYWRCRSRSYFLELLILADLLSRNKRENVVTHLQESSDEIDQIILYLHTHYVEKLSIPQLTRQFKVNRTTLTERFSAVTGESVMSYLNQLRIRLAAAMLRDTMLPIAEITERVGFGDVTHFGRMFRKTTSLAPSEYREKYCFMIRR
jgi:AraC family L-rhamnose operon regulatory protein RhaS